MINDKNFKFLENYSSQIKNYEFIEQNINKFNQYIINSDWNSLMLCIRQILERYFPNIYEMLEINYDDYNNKKLLGEKIEEIKDKLIIVSGYEIYNILKWLNKTANKYIHSNENVSHSNKSHDDNSFTSVQMIFYICKILYYFKDKNFELKNFVFDQVEYININNQLNISSVKENDLNLFIDSKLITIEDLFKKLNGIILIPIYQRNYVWDENNINVLINDIEDNSKYENPRNHYLGSIATKKIHSDDNKDKIKIIDGQQRITTSLLFIVAIRDILFLNTKQKINNFEIIYEDNFKNYMNTLIFNNEENRIFKNLILFKENVNEKIQRIQEIKNKNFSNHSIKNIINNYLIFYETYKDYSNEKILEIFNQYVQKFNLTLISFNEKIYKNKDEMKIFDSINSKGSKLELSDLMKNYILNLCNNSVLENESSSRKIIEEYNNYFNDKVQYLNEFFESIGAYYKEKELKNKEFVKFQSIKEAINKILKRKCSNEKYDNLNIDEYIEFINQLNKYYKIFNYLVKTNDKHNTETPPIIKKFDLKNVLTIIKFKEWNKSIIYYIYLLHETFEDIDETKIRSIHKKEVKKILLTIIEYLITRQLKVSQGDSTIKREILELYSKLKNKLNYHSNNYLEENINIIQVETNNELYIDNDLYNTFSEKLLQPIDSDQLKMTILLLVSYYMSNCLESNSVLSESSSNATLEHIMPQDLSYEWNNDLDSEYKNQTKEWLELEHKKHVNLLGNCLVITKEINSKIKNNIFKLKKEMFNNYCSSNKLYDNNNWIKIGVKNYNKWNFENIDERTKALYAYITNKIITKNNRN